MPTQTFNGIEGYHIVEQDMTGTDWYYGYQDKYGNWYIQKHIGGGSMSVSIRYTKGASDFSTNWTNRVTLSYDYYTEVFG